MNTSLSSLTFKTRDQSKAFCARLWASKDSCFLVALALVLGFAMYLRFPFISSGLPYFYDEDEGHHFNRIVEMVQDQRLNPGYFLKPTLHFYLRMPIVGAAFLWQVKKGNMRSTDEIRTRDPHGLSGYSFTASHPSIVKWNRAFSLLLSLGAVGLAMLITYHLTQSAGAAGIGGLALAVSPPLVEGSTIIGVDVVVTFFAIATLALAILYLQRASFSHLLFLGLCAGLTISSKYNAAPIAVLPLMAVLFRPDVRLAPFHLPWSHILAALALPVLGFVLGTPYCLITPGLFLDQIAFEVFHYAVAGHEGHMANPGIEQVIHYGHWFGERALGWPLLVLALMGIVSASRKNPRLSALLFTFPALYFLLMINQKANFVRNMHVVLPFLSIAIGIACAYALSQAAQLKRPVISYLVSALFLVVMIPQLAISLSERAAAEGLLDSREKLRHWLKTTQLPEGEYAISGKLQMLGLGTMLDSSVFDPAKTDEKTLWLEGYRGFIAEPYTILRPELALSQEMYTTGSVQEAQRIVNDPKLSVRTFKTQLSPLQLPLKELPESVLTEDGQGPGTMAKDSQTWIKSRITSLEVKLAKSFKEGARIKLHVFSPWPKQKITLFSISSGQLQEVAKLTWEKPEVREMIIPLTEPHQKFLLTTEIIRSPAKAGMNRDTRRLGVELQP